MNKLVLNVEVQEFINRNIDEDVHRIALSRSPFEDITAAELAVQIAGKKKCRKKLPKWFAQPGIYYPPLISIEQCSSEATARYKSKLANKGRLIDLTGGFGVDCYYFSKKVSSVKHCEINEELSAIVQHNFGSLEVNNATFLSGDGIEYLKSGDDYFETIYIDPARRSAKGKVFMLEDCSPDVTKHLDFLMSKGDKILIKTSPLLDISMVLKTLKNISEIHILSVANECKELLLVVERLPAERTKIKAVTINEKEKSFSFYKSEDDVKPLFSSEIKTYLYEPDTALLKSGAFNLIANRYGLDKLQAQTHLYTSDHLVNDFPGRIFSVKDVLNGAVLKKQRSFNGNVIVRNYKETPEVLIRKYKIRATQRDFLIFTQSKTEGYILIKAEIIQYY